MTKPNISKNYTYNTPQHQYYKFVVTYRFVLAFILGYVLSAWFNANMAYFAYHALGMAKAESVFLALLLTLIFACIWVISVFCIQSLKLLSSISLILLIIFAIIRFSVIK